MKKEEIKQLFILLAAVKEIPEDDQRRPQLEAKIAELREKYLDHYDAVNGDEEAQKREEAAAVPWEDALGYVGSLFDSMDKNEQEEHHEGAKAVRSKVWEIISNGVSNWYCQEAQKKNEKS